MPHRYPHVVHLRPSRPLDRGEMEGLPGLAPALHDDMAEPPVDADALESALPRRRIPSRPTRVAIEAALGLMLAGTLASLLLSAASTPQASGLKCPAGTTPAVMLATACTADGHGNPPE
ncbi:MAG: hypothetical protein U1E62_00285 [Alsobacter sp.]